ncbi:MAG: AMP-binding protein, partial [Chthoniobacteraceae bacterium]
GVIVPHQGIMRLVVNNDYAPFRADDTVAFASNVCFDAATFEIWGALLNGAALVITPRDVLLSPSALARHLALYRIGILFLTTSLFNRLAHEAPAMFGGLRTLVFGGETADAESVRLVLAHGRPRRLVNGYGPTETTTFAICHTIEHAGGASIPIGRPIANTRVFLLDAAQQPVPIGVAGEICIGGPGVALGYLGEPGLTAESFVETAHGRLYRAGDRARWQADGTIDYLGRKDQQVKLRGFRIEPGEIETALQQHPQIRHAAVAVHAGDAGENALIAYIVAEPGGRLEDITLREFLSQRVPGYMIPSAFVWMDALPLTANGKLDTQRLPAPEATAAATPAGAVPPRNECERGIAAIWKRALGRDASSVLEDFFTAGGHSLLALRLLVEIRNQFGIEVPARRLFETPTIAGLSEYVLARTTEAVPARKYLMPVQKGSTALRPLFLVAGGWGGEIEFLVYGELSRQIDPARPVWGLKARGAGTGDAPHSTVTEMAADYLREIRQLQPNGPYLLAGECVGGICAYEMACQLEKAGEIVALVMLLDTVVPAHSQLNTYLDAEARKRDSEARQFSLFRRVRHHLAEMSGLSLREKFDYISNKALGRKKTNPATEPQAPGEHPRGQKDYPVTLLRHRLQPYGGTVTLLVDEESEALHGNLGWDKVSLGRLETHILPGTHLTYIRENSAAAAATLRELLLQTTPHLHNAPATV